MAADADQLAEQALDAAGLTEPGAGDAAPKRARTRKSSSSSSAAPRKRGRPPGSTAAVSARKRIDARAAALGELLVIPAIPCMMVGNDFLVGHFTGAAGPTAARLAELAEQSPELANLIDNAGKGGLYIGLLMVALGYVGPVALHLLGRTDAAQAASMAVVMQGNPQILAQMMGAAAGPGTGADPNPQNLNDLGDVGSVSPQQ